jgi:phage terminase Nu1 subunit (DNA packaging protein)
MGLEVNKSELEEILGVSHQTLTDWQQEDPPLPIKERASKRGQSHKYDTAEVITWYVQRQTRDIQVETPRDRLARLQSEEIELRLAEKRGLLVSVDKIEPMWMGMVGSARAYLRAEVNRLAQLLDHTVGVEAKRDLLGETFDQFLNKLSGYDPDENITGASAGGAPAHAALPGAPAAAAADLGGEMGRAL